MDTCGESRAGLLSTVPMIVATDAILLILHIIIYYVIYVELDVCCILDLVDVNLGSLKNVSFLVPLTRFGRSRNYIFKLDRVASILYIFYGT